MDPQDIINMLTAENRKFQKKLEVSEKARSRTEKFKNQNQEVLEQVNTKLVNTLEQLQTTQMQLIQAEKMASLGQLISGVSHEINTPAGAIVNSVEEIARDYPVYFDKLVNFVSNMTPQLNLAYLKNVHILSHKKETIGTSEERKIAKEIEQILKENGISFSLSMCRNLAMIGYNSGNIHNSFELFKSPFVQDFYELLNLIGMNLVHIRNIQIGIQKIIHLVKALKLYSRTEQDELGMTRLDEDIQTTLTILHNRLKRGINVIKEFEALPEIKCYADQLNQVWTNIINNAIEAMKGEGQIIIRLKKLDEELIKVEIEDNGPGIPESILDRIYQPYFTTKPKGEGTGLGLSISKTIIDKHNGKLEVESQPGKTVFRVILPITLNK